MTVVGIASAVALVDIPAHAGTSPKPALDNHSVPPPAGIAGSWTLVLDSEFDGARLPHGWLAGWQRRGVTAPVNRSEPDCYSPANVSLPGDGTLHLSVTAQPSRCAGVVKPFTGAIVTTNPAHRGVGGGFTYTFGVLQARVYVPGNGAGIVDWPAVWTDGRRWPRDGEDDVMEGLNGVACFHFDDLSGRHGGCDPQLTPGWHTFASDWEPGRVVYYYDGARVGSVRGVTAAPMYIVIDNTVSARPGARAVEAAVRVQYVRVWQRS
jgi:beta-glucanase (GH16 family)